MSAVGVATPGRMAEGREAAAKVARRRLTHCKRGHEMTGDNIIHRASGKRSCRACDRLRRERERERWAAGDRTSRSPMGPYTEVLPVGPFVGWLESRPETLHQLCTIAKTQPRVLFRSRKGEQDVVTLDVVDRFITRIEGPELLNEMYPLCDVCLDGIAEDDDDARCGLGIEEVNGTWKCKDHL